MPNANTEAGFTQGSPPVMQHARDTGHPFERLRTFSDVLDYAARVRDHALAYAAAAKDPTAAKLWRDAADEYVEAHDTILTLQGLPENDRFAKAKDLLHEANHKADEAAAVSGEDS